MRFVVLAAFVLLAGCVEQPYVPSPIELQPYPPPLTYRTDPYSLPPTVLPPTVPPPTLPPLAEPLPQPSPLVETPDAVVPPPSDDTGAIPLQQMPAPAPDVPAPTDTSTAPAPTTPSVSRTPVAGPGGPGSPGSNVPLEGFRPMHGQTRPAP